jgi:hypothetical protein
MKVLTKNEVKALKEKANAIPPKGPTALKNVLKLEVGQGYTTTRKRASTARTTISKYSKDELKGRKYSVEQLASNQYLISRIK